MICIELVHSDWRSKRVYNCCSFMKSCERYCPLADILNIGTKIYHLPFDQQYDKTKLEKKYGELYCKTVKEAEDAGFRRAFRYRIGKEK